MTTKDLKVTVFQGDNRMTVEQAMELLGWTTAGEGQPQDWDGKDATFKVKLPGSDSNKATPVKLINSRDNRPMRMSLVTRYKNKILNGQWAGMSNCKKYATANGESLGIDSNGQATSLQHRLTAFILAELTRKADPAAYGKKPLTLQAILVEGIDPHAADTVDLGQNRTTADVLFRRHEFNSTYTDAEKKTLTRILAGATRLVWIRSNGRNVSGGGKFEHEDMLEFLEDHPRLHDAVEYIYQAEKSGDGKCLSPTIQLPYAAAMLYLAGTSSSTTSYDENSKQHAHELSYDNWDKAETFWEMYASGAGLGAKSPILVLQKYLATLEKSGAENREIVVVAATRAFNKWMDGKEVTRKMIQPKKSQRDGKLVLTDDERHGGIDLNGDVLAEMVPVTVDLSPFVVGQTITLSDDDEGTVEVVVDEVFDKPENAEVYSANVKYPSGDIYEVTSDMIVA